jgi:hypothetical protein
MMLFDRNLFQGDSWRLLDEWESDDGLFRNQVHVTTAAFPEEAWPESTFWRIASHMIINRLTGDVLKEAFEALADYYRWQIDQARITGSEPEIEIVQRSPSVRYVERQPFDIPE